MSENNLKRDYPRIFLTDELGEVNWCQDRITAEDVEYVPVSDLLAAQAEMTRLREAIQDIHRMVNSSVTLKLVETAMIYAITRSALAPKEPS